MEIIDTASKNYNNGDIVMIGDDDESCGGGSEVSNTKINDIGVIDSGTIAAADAVATTTTYP